MKRSTLVIGLLVTFVAIVSVTATAQVKKGQTRAALTKQIMSGLVQPTDDKAWGGLATNAALLNEVSYTLMDDGRCPDAAWADAAKSLRAGSEAVLAKIEAKDWQGAATEFKTMTQACGACHKVHKK